MPHITAKSKWPDDKKFAVCLTHDVDRVKKTYQYFTRSGRFLKRMQIKDAFNEIFSFSKLYFRKDCEKDPYWNFERIMDIERKLDVKSTFFFLYESGKISIFKPRTWKLYLGRYNIKNPKIVKIIKRLNSEGWEIGLHGSYESYKNKDLLKKEKGDLEKILGHQVYGIRQHYLNLDIPITWEIQEELGFKYDSSFGFRDRIGFKENRYFPFHLVDSSFLEIPLSIMDTALFSRYNSLMNIWEECERIVEIAERKGAVLSLSWHQRSFNEKDFPDRIKIYGDLIKLCEEKKAWITTAGEIRQWWTQQVGKS